MTIDISEKTKSLIGENIRRVRLQLGQSVEEFAEQAGIARAYWYEIESGAANATVDTLANIATALDVSVRDLLEPPRKSRNGNKSSGDPSTVFAQSKAPEKRSRRRSTMKGG